jgi:hypothetical protein
MTPEQRRARARIAGLTAHANGSTNTAPASAAAEARYAREVRDEAVARGETISGAEVERRAAINESSSTPASHGRVRELEPRALAVVAGTPPHSPSKRWSRGASTRHGSCP